MEGQSSTAHIQEIVMVGFWILVELGVIGMAQLGLGMIVLTSIVSSYCS
jgi:hypothetical protein